MAATQILLVGDDRIVAATIRERLDGLGYTVVAVAGSGEAALRHIALQRPDLVLVDMGQDGPAVAAAIRARFDIPIVYLSTSADEAAIRRAVLTEPYGYIHAPFEAPYLQATIAIALQRHALERAARAHEQQLRALIDHLPVMLFAIDAVGAITVVEGRIAEIAGLPPQQLVGMHIFDAFPDYPESLAAIRRALDGEEAGWTGDFHGRFLEIRMSPVRDPCGTITGVVGIGVDVTAQRQAEDRYRLFEMAVQQAEEGVIIAEEVGGEVGRRILFVNRSFTRITGHAAEDVLGRSPAALLAPNSGAAAMAQVRQALREGLASEVEGILVRKDGTTFVGALNIAPLRDARGQITHWVATLRDITQRRRAQEGRWRRQKLESLGVLAGGIAHDFNNLLTVILGTASLAASDHPPGSPAAEALETIERAAQRAAELTRQMLAYAGKGRLFVELVDLNRLVREVTAPPALEAPANVTLRYELAAQLPTLVADAAQVRRVVQQLIGNAIEAIGEARGDVTIRTSLRRVEGGEVAGVHLSADLPAGEYVALEVADTGSGMDDATRERVFEPFFSTRFTGRGLGLSEVLGIVSGHGGTVTVVSAPGHGATFTVFLPLEPGAEDQVLMIGGPARGAAHAAQAAGAGPVLVIEDEPGLREIAARILERAGYRVLTAEDGAAGLEVFQQHGDAVACVLLDLTMPRMDGEQALRAIRRLRPDARVVLMSGYSEHELSERFAGAGLAGVLQKPFTPEALLARVEQAIG
ncbi:MAG TPA: response regulator [Roseiflexaceae bacterium]|nr:response regulator [Roseiflexaceae bacterium]